MKNPAERIGSNDGWAEVKDGSSGQLTEAFRLVHLAVFAFEVWAPGTFFLSSFQLLHGPELHQDHKFCKVVKGTL